MATTPRYGNAPDAGPLTLAPAASDVETVFSLAGRVRVSRSTPYSPPRARRYTSALILLDVAGTNSMTATILLNDLAVVDLTVPAGVERRSFAINLYVAVTDNIIATVSEASDATGLTVILR